MPLDKDQWFSVKLSWYSERSYQRFPDISDPTSLEHPCLFHHGSSENKRLQLLSKLTSVFPLTLGRKNGRLNSGLPSTVRQAEK